MIKLYKSFKIIMIIFAFIQIYCINIFMNEKNIVVHNTQNNFHHHKTLNEFMNELNYIEGINVISAKEIDGKWYVRVKLNGNKDELSNELMQLKSYDISDYIIDKNKNENYVILEICAKESI